MRRLGLEDVRELELEMLPGATMISNKVCGKLGFKNDRAPRGWSLGLVTAARHA